MVKSLEENGRLPNWTLTCKMILLVQPSLAAAEYIFFLYPEQFLFTQQESSLEDYILLSLILEHSHRKTWSF